MKKTAEREKKPQILWQREERTLTLTGEPVLELALSWPRAEGPERFRRALDRHYARLAAGWKKQWEREVYLRACVDLAGKRERSRPFTPWRGELAGEVKLLSGELASIAMTAREFHGDGRVLEYRWGDTWRCADGAPVTLSGLYAGERGWRRKLRRELERAARQAWEAGLCLDRDLSGPLRRFFSSGRFALTGEGMEVYYPQCALAPAAEGAPVFRVPLPPGVKPEGEGGHDPGPERIE